MANTETLPTFDEFRNAVKGYYMDLQKSFPAEESERYFNGDEAAAEIQHGYERNVRNFQSGDATRKQFLVGGASSVAYCLYMMFE